MLSPTTVEKMKVPYNDLYCEAQVETLMQIGNEVIDIVETIDNLKDCEKPKEDVIKETVVKKERSRAKGSTDVKPRKPRRMRKKSSRQHPYNNLARVQAQLSRRQKIRAPVNTTQFLMSDRANFDTYSDSENENKFEGNFVQKEFYKEYEKEAANRQKTKSKLIEEFVVLEKDVVHLEKRYEEKRAQEQLKARLGAVDYDFEKGEVAMEPEVAEKIRILHEEIVKLTEENRLIQDENSLLKSSGFTTDSGSSSDSDSDSSSSEDESDSDSSSSSSSSSEDEDEVGESPKEVVPTSTAEVAQSNLVSEDLEQRREDTGYESDSNDLTRVTSTTFRK